MNKIIKKGYSWYRDCEKLVDSSSGFMLILAFVIVLPTMQEFQYAWLGSFLTLAVAVNIIFKRMEREFPEIRLEEDFKRSIKNSEEKIKFLEKRIKKSEGGKK